MQDKTNLAAAELSEFINERVLNCQARGWSYELVIEAPETYKDLLASSGSKVIPILSGGSDTSIYGNEVNCKFRFWHDVIHLENNLSFSLKNELAVAEIHLDQGKTYGLSKLALQVLEIDTRGQVEYYFQHKQFIENQKAFVDDCLKHGLQKVLRTGVEY